MVKIAGVVMIVFGVAALIYGGISYTTDETVLDAGPVKAEVTREKSIPLPPIIGAVVLAGGLVLLVLGARKK